jgi:ADP-heptose:LPS heptosyltransferase
LAIEVRTGTRGAVIAFLSGANTRIARYANDGTLWRNPLFTHLVRPTRENVQYAAQHNLNIMAPFGLSAKDPKPRISLPEYRRQSAEAIFEAAGISRSRPLVAVHPFSLWQYKEWQPSEMAFLLDRIQAEYHCSVVVTGAPNERDRAQDLIGLCHGKPYNLAGETSIGELPAVLEACSLFIGVDTAALHMAAAVGVPTVGYSVRPLGPTGRRGERTIVVVQKNLSCQPCSQKGCDGSERSRCLLELTAVEAHETMKKMLQKALPAKGERHPAEIVNESD